MSPRHLLSGVLIVGAGVALFAWSQQPVQLDRFVARTGVDAALTHSAAAVADIVHIPAATFTSHKAEITEVSPKLFAYAHGTAMAHDKIFLGLAAVHGNTYPTNEIVVFEDLDHLDKARRVVIPGQGDIQTMVYDEHTDKIYFIFSKNQRLDAYALDPNSYTYTHLVSTTSVDVGDKPAIVTDGTYVYGITNTNPSTVFKIRIADGVLTYDTRGHIDGGHSAAMGMNGSSTELYFGGGTSGMFEKTDAATLRPISRVTMRGCVLTNDLPYGATDANSGYVYVGCETTPEGYRIRTSDLDTARFPLPGQSFGLFIFGNDLYNASYDGHIDVFPGKDIGNLHRYYVTNGMQYSVAPGNELYINQMFYDPKTNDLYMTAWWNVQNLFRVKLGN